jgi:hypothetical protein
MSADMNNIACGVHGAKEWKGTVVCEHCGRKYQTSDESAPRYAPEVCDCGKRLMPDSAQLAGGGFTARAICSDCFAGN